MKTKIKEIWSKLIGWFWIIIAMTIFAVITALLSNWIQDKVWIVLVLDTVFFLLFWLMMKKASYWKNRRLSSSNAILLAVLICLMAFTLTVLASVSLALLDHLLVRLNVILFVVAVFFTTYLVFRKNMSN